MRDRTQELVTLLQRRILIIDGAMGTMIQRRKLTDADYRGARFADHPADLKGNNDLLSLTKPDVIASIHRAYLDAGADIIETNTFNANAMSQADYDLQDLVAELNEASARIAREVADAASTPERPRFVAGVLGPANRTASLSPDVNDPGYRNVTFEDLRATYLDAARALVRGGADILLIETIFDTLNAKAAVFAVLELFDELGHRMPVMISGTITDASGRTLSGQTTEAFWNSLRHAQPLSIGLNCALGSKELRPYIAELSRVANTFVSAHPNAGLPNEFGEYDESPEHMAGLLQEFATSGLLNLVGGCCGTSPDHIRAIADAVADRTPRTVPELPPVMRLSGLEPFTADDGKLFINIGERTNVTGSARFRRLIKEGKLEDALSVARQQVTNGAQLIDVNMDEGLLDSEAAMRQFLNLVASEPDISRVPVVIDSSKWSVIEEGLQCIQGKGVVNSISLKEGEEKPSWSKPEARSEALRSGGVIVMAFDEESVKRSTADHASVEICKRAYKHADRASRLSARGHHLRPQHPHRRDTGMEEHNNYGGRVSSKRTADHQRGNAPGRRRPWRREQRVLLLPRQRTSCGRRFTPCSCITPSTQGMDMGIVNAGQLAVYDDLSKPNCGSWSKTCSSIGARTRPSASSTVAEYADAGPEAAERRPKTSQLANEQEWHGQERLEHALVKGITDLHRGRHRGGPQNSPRPLRRHRGPAHGWHERRWRPVRGRQDVPAAGGESPHG